MLIIIIPGSIFIVAAVIPILAIGTLIGGEVLIILSLCISILFILIVVVMGIVIMVLNVIVFNRVEIFVLGV